MLFQQTISNHSFKKWIWEDKENKIMYCFALIIIVVSFTWLKLIYPYPNFMPPDSNNYLEAAQENLFINIWPIGYSKFLKLVGLFSHSHLALVIVQYGILQASLLYFLFTTRYLFAPGKWLFRMLLSASILNPLLPHIANFVSSDCLFAALSVLWYTQILWIMYRPNQTLLLIHAIVLLLAFMVRFNALYYPFVSISIIILSRMPKRNKWLSVSIIAFLLLAFIGRTQYEYQKKTGTIQFAAFGGWQIAANALYGYAYAKIDHSEKVPQKFMDLHKLVIQHMDSMRRLTIRPDSKVGVYYLWDFNSPLRVYMEHRWKHDSTSPFLKKWSAMAPLYAAYGKYLTLHHPVEFLQHYAWPNLQRYYSPPSMFMGLYNMGNKTVEPIAMTWFGLKTNKLIVHSDNLQIPIAQTFSIIMPVINLIFMTGIISFVCLAGFKNCNPTYKKIISCILGIWLSNIIFSVLSAPIELRYQIFPFIIILVWAIFFVTYLVQAINSKLQNDKANEQSISAGLKV